VSPRLSVLRRLLDDGGVRRLELAFSGFNVAEYGVWVSVLVYAFEHGGAPAAGIVAAAQLLPAAVLAPVLARSIDRRGAARALCNGYWLQATALGSTSLLMLATAPALVVYGAAITAAVAVTTTRPAQAALTPALAGSPERITAVNVLSGWVESLGVLAGPALAGLLIAVDGPGAAVAAFAMIVMLAALLTAGISSEGAGCPPVIEGDAGQASGAGCASGALRDHPDLALLVALLGTQYLVIGVLDVALVVLAIQVLGLGAAGAGFLTAAFGAGAVVGSLVAVLLIGRLRLTMPLLGAALGWAGLFGVLGAWPTVLGSFLLLSAAGAMRSVMDVSGRTILLRATPAVVRHRVFGLLEGVAMLGLAAGSLLVPLLDSLGGPGMALITSAALVGVVSFSAAGALRRLEANGPGRRASAPVLTMAVIRASGGPEPSRL
jgi:hypothetical protein